jgi:hypothetical protein
MPRKIQNRQFKSVKILLNVEASPEKTKENILETKEKVIKSEELKVLNSTTAPHAIIPKNSTLKAHSKIPVNSEKKIPPIGKMEISVHALARLKSQIRREDKASLNKKIDLDEDESAPTSERVIELKYECICLRKRVQELLSQNAILNRRVIKEQERTKHIPKTTSIVPTSLEVKTC